NPRTLSAGREFRIAFDPIVRALPVDYVSPVGREGLFWSHQHCIYGRVGREGASDAGNVESVKGVSGGPAVSIERTSKGHVRYRLFGLQSAWLSESRIVRIEPEATIAKMLELEFREYRRWARKRAKQKQPPQHP